MSTVASIMTRKVLTLDPEMSLREAVEELGNERVSGAPVVSGTRLVGVVSATDILQFQGANPAIESPDDSPPSLRDELEDRAWEDSSIDDHPASFFVDLWGDGGPDVYQRLSASNSPKWDLLARHTVGEVMTRKIVSLAPGTRIREAARLMTNRRIHRLLVTDDGELVGIITSMDLVRAIAEGRITPSSELP